MKDVDALKDKVIKEFHDFICQLQKGHTPNQEFILEEISLIDLIDYNSLSVLQYYANNYYS